MNNTLTHVTILDGTAPRPILSFLVRYSVFRWYRYDVRWHALWRITDAGAQNEKGKLAVVRQSSVARLLRAY